MSGPTSSNGGASPVLANRLSNRDRPLPSAVSRLRGQNQRRESVGSLVKIIRGQAQSKGDALAANQKTLAELKKSIALGSKKNFALESDIRNLDQKIALLIKNRISLEDVLASSQDSNAINRTTTIKDKHEREYYGQLFHLLQNETKYMARLARLVKLGEIDSLLQTVMFTLYGNQYEDNEEHLLLSMFQLVLRDEFAEANSLGNVLRANTALTRMMTTYTRRGPGQAYIKQTLTPPLNMVCSQPNLDLEVNPLKVYENYVNDYEVSTGKVCTLNRKPTPEEAAENAEVQKIIQGNVKKLEEITDKFIEAFLASVETVPYGIRWICKQIKELVKQRFPSVTKDQVCSLIGGFYILRYINPAIVTPQAFMLVETKLSAHTRRNLTLLAKVLQNMANNIDFGGLKENYMAPLNYVLQKNKARFNKFLEDLTDVVDLDDHLHMDRYIALGKTSDDMIHITMNEMYFVQSLLVQQQDTLAPPGDPLREILNDLGTPPPQVPKKDNATIDLLLTNRFKGKEDDSKVDTRPEQLYAETKYLVFDLVRALPTIREDDDDIMKIIQDATEYASKANDKALSDKVKKVNSNLKTLIAEKVISGDNNFGKLRNDLMQELLNYESQLARTLSDIERLKAVLNSIQQHYNFLNGQFEAYKFYLDDVRSKCVTQNKVKEKTKAEKKKDEKKTKKVLGPFKFTYNNLEKDGVIIESEVPEDKKGNVSFSFMSPTPGVFDVEVTFRGKSFATITLHLDDLLERQHNNNTQYETEFLKLNVNLLIHLLNKTFIS